MIATSRSPSTRATTSSSSPLATRACSIAGAIAANTAWSADALDALAAHCITVLNVALTSITDAAEARAIGKLLG